MLPWQRGLPDISSYQNCSERGLSFIDAFTAGLARNHLAVGIIFCGFAYYRFCVCAAHFIRFQAGAGDWTGWDFFTPIPRCIGKYVLPWKLSWEVVFKGGQVVVGLRVLIITLIAHVPQGETPVTDYRFLIPVYEKSFELDLGVASAMLFSAAVDVIYYNSKFRLLPNYSPHLAFGLIFQVNGLLFITHAIWMESLMQMAMHLMSVVFYLGTAAALYLTPLWPRSFYLLTLQCLGLGCLGLHFCGMAAYFTAWGMFDASLDPWHPCREWMIVMSAFENLEIVWLGVNFNIVFNATVLTALFVFLSVYCRKKGFCENTDSNSNLVSTDSYSVVANDDEITGGLLENRQLA